jgi:glycosyltransferase involved in cell wall biosynthesis
VRGLWLDRPDVVIATSPQLLVGLSGWILARRFRRPFVFEVRDLWPDSLPASGVSRVGSTLYNVLDRLAGFLYRSADLIVPVTERFKPAIAGHGGRAPLEVIENGVDPALFRPLPDAEYMKQKIGLQGRFVASYIGTIGFAHGLETLLQAAAILKDRRPEVLFLLVGEGAERQKLEDRARAEGLTNVRFVGQRPRTEIPEFIAASDAGLVMLRGASLFETVLPSKMLEYMACACPVILGVNGFARSLLEQSGGGIAIPPEDPQALAGQICHLQENPVLVEQLGANARRFVLARFTREAKAAAYITALEAVATS